MEKGQRIPGKDHPGKTIIFAANQKHAKYIAERFDILYPQYKGTFAEVIHSNIRNNSELIDAFKAPDKHPIIAISVDMLDTGIDVQEILNLVFFKKVMSKTKFWQMIGRGTRLCENLFGSGKDKQCFYIFDYLSNFEFFGENPNGIEAAETLNTSESIFCKKVSLIQLLQSSDLTSDHQIFRNGLIDDVTTQVKALNTEIASVRLQRQYVEKYKQEEVFSSLTDIEKAELTKYIAPLVFFEEPDDNAKQFDNFMYGLMLVRIEKPEQVNAGKKRLTDTAARLSERASMPQIKEKIELIKAIQTDAFWKSIDIMALENIRQQLRGLIKFLVEDNSTVSIYTNLSDEIVKIKEGRRLKEAYDFDDYRLKVNRYIEDNKDNLSIHKLRNNLPLTDTDYKALENVFTGELGTQEDYEREFGKTPFGLLVRKVAKLEQEAANEVFSEFINDQNLNQNQIVFIKKVIDYIVQNGYIENTSELLKPPFDKPASFIKLFDTSNQKRIVQLLEQVRNNALAVNE